jgi:hypothetical protein
MAENYPFCDWITIRQDHWQNDLSKLQGCKFIKLDEDGVKVFEVAQGVELEGSFDTKIKVSCDGTTVFFSGNIGRFGRENNLFGYSVEQCISLVNQLIVQLGYPPFSTGRRARITDELIETGAVISRLDLTQNYVVATADVVPMLKTFYGWKLDRQSNPTQFYEKTQGVSWNYGSRSWNVKIYNKSIESKIYPNDDEKLTYLRCEVSFKSTYLANHSINRIRHWQGDATMSNILDATEFFKYKNQLNRAENQTKNTDLVDALPTRALKQAAQLYFDHNDLKLYYGKAQFYAIRKKLRVYGIDISERIDVIKMPILVRPVFLQPVPLPLEFQRGQAVTLPFFDKEKNAKKLRLVA